MMLSIDGYERLLTVYVAHVCDQFSRQCLSPIPGGWSISRLDLIFDPTKLEKFYVAPFSSSAFPIWSSRRFPMQIGDPTIKMPHSLIRKCKVS